MRALLISDIHANLPALEAVLVAAPEYDVVWNLGDVVGYGANPNEVVQMARTLGGSVIRGNHDRACGGMMKFGQLRDFSALATAAVRWTQGVLTTENKDWLAKLTRGPVWPIPRRVQCVHGAPWDEDEYLFFREDASIALGESRARIVFFGHTHWQVDVAHGRTRPPREVFDEIRRKYGIPDGVNDTQEVRQTTTRILQPCGLSTDGIDSWWRGLCSYLDDQTPNEVIDEDPEWVLEAAIDAAEEMHGRIT